MPNNKNLVLITSAYPFSRIEPYIENEMPFLSTAFENIYIICHCNNSQIAITPPTNTKVFRYTEKQGFLFKLKCLLLLFNINFYKEVFSIICLKQNLNLKVIKSIIIELQKAYDFKIFLSKNIPENIINSSETVFYSYWNDFKTTALAIIKSKQHNLKAVSRAHGWDVFYERHPENYIPFRNLIAQYIPVFYVSQKGMNYTKEKVYPEFHNNIRVSYLGTHAASCKNPINTDKYLHIFSCSNKLTLKRLDLIIRALHTISDINIKWTHIGQSEYTEEIINNENWTKLADSLLSSRPNIKYSITGRKSHEEIYEFYKSTPIDLLINVSSTEGLAISMMEAMSFAVPVVATNVGGTSEIINKCNGILMSADPQPEEIASAIRIYNNYSREEIVNMRIAAHNTWKAKFDADKNYQQFSEYLKTL